MARRRWIADEWVPGTTTLETAVLTGAQARHLARVLRAEPGMRYDVVADNRVWSAVVAAVSEERVEFRLGEELPADAPLPLTLLLAVWKFDRMEWAIEKLTELGVERIVPAIARRTEKHLAQAAAARVERWRRIAREAAKQSRRADVPAIADPLSLKNALDGSLPRLKLLLAENERTVLLRDTLDDLQDDAEPVMLAVGPEGGWSPEEEALFSQGEWKAVSLGPRILRAETAAVAGTAILASALLR